MEKFEKTYRQIQEEKMVNDPSNLLTALALIVAVGLIYVAYKAVVLATITQYCL